MKICVIGAGAIGGWIAGLLAEASAEVSLLARGATLSALNANGLRVRRGGVETVYRLKAQGDAARLERPDAVIVALKGQSIPAATPSIAALLGPDTIVVPAVNGIPWWFFEGPNVPLAGLSLASVDPGGIIARAIPPARVVGCVVHASAWTPEPGVVEVQGEDRLILGEPDGGESGRVRALAAAFGQSSVKLVASDNIRRDIWTKLWGNMTMNPLSVLTGATTKRMLTDPDVRGLVRSMMLEMQQLGTAIGLPIAMTPDERMDVTLRLGDIKTSMLRDFEAGREIEIGPILGALAEIADRAGQDAPYLHAVLGLLRVRAGTA
ncbi:MAG TPA: 2-dehydropantoate 2-reductase [Rhizomicrobium sp.]|jgi:2-dehydropantoate 2-reductase|nr:2-dehydropantoate 2-reductase [Rhizomicrobium sp.]